jgi:hypothetical protein
MYISLNVKNCEPFTMKHKPIYRCLQVAVVKDHDHGYPMIVVVYSHFRRSHVVVVDGYSLILAVIMVVGGGYLIPRFCIPVGSSFQDISYIWGRGRRP